MTVDTTENKIPETIAQDKIETNIQQKIDTNSPAQQSAAAPKEKEVDEDPNFKAFREGRKKDRAAREEAERRAAEKDAEVAALKAAMEAAFSKQTQRLPDTYNPSYPTTYQSEETEDEKIEKKIQAAIAAREEQYRKEAEEREKREAPQKIQQIYPDFSQVVNQENCDYIDYHYPELSAPFAHMPEGISKWSAMYNLIKKVVPNAKTAKKEAARADQNMAKPRSISSTGLTQSQTLSSGQILTDERRAANWARMQQVMKGVS